MNCPHGFSSILPFTALHHGLRIGSQHQGQLQECVAPLALVLHWGPTHGFAPLPRSSPWANLWVHLRCSVHRNASLVYPKEFMTQNIQTPAAGFLPVWVSAVLRFSFRPPKMFDSLSFLCDALSR